MRGLVIPCVLACVASCGDPGTFTDQELRAIRDKMGAIPAQPPPDVSNQYADDPRAAALGAKLFFEDRYSGNGAVSCATCHDPGTGFQDARANTSMGLGFTGRHAPPVTYLPLGQHTEPHALWEFWDGRSDSQWAQALGPPENAVEMGSSRTKIAYLLYDLYRVEYEAVFGAMPVLRDVGNAPLFPLDAKPGMAEWEALAQADKDALTGIYVAFGKALAAYERRLIPTGSRFDAFYTEIAAGATDSPLLSFEEKQGLRVFIGQGGCLECHDGPALTDFKFHNIGVAQTGANIPPEDRGREAGIAKLLASEFHCASRWSDHPQKTECAVSGLAPMPTDLGAFKTSHLRGLSSTAPYMHTGTFPTLEAVIDHYDHGGDPSGFVGLIDDRVAALELAAAEKKALLAFLRTLDGEPLPADLTTPPTRPGAL